MTFPPLDRAIWACPVCGFIDPDQHSRRDPDEPGVCPFSFRGGGVNTGYRHPYGDDRARTSYVLVEVTALDEKQQTDRP